MHQSFGHSMLHSLYWLTQTLADVPRQDDWLTPAERACLAKLRFPKRRAEWRLGLDGEVLLADTLKLRSSSHYRRNL
jgi:hypothetical protein